MAEPSVGVSDVVSGRVEAVLARLDFRAQVGQLNQRLLGWRAVERTSCGFRLSTEGRSELERWGGLGALYGLFRADAWSGRNWTNGIRPEERAEVAAAVQREVREVSGIGVLLSEEAPHGHQALGGSLLPTPSSMAATWDPDLVGDAAAAVAAQLTASGVHLALVSTLDVLRDPRWGRAEECFGEDPYLAARFTTAIVEGMQGKGRSEVGRRGVAVVLKHLAAQGEAIGGRNGQSAVIGPLDLEELHLRPVRAGVDAGALGFMAAYNDIDGVPCCANPALLQGLLRDSAGFDGIVMADGFAVDRLTAAGGDVAAAGRTALLAGVDLSLWDDGFAALDRFADDPVVVAAVRVACRRVLELKQRFGLLDPPAAHDTVDRVGLTIEPGERLSAQLAERSLVLLTNRDAALPLRSSGLRQLLVAGPFADDVEAMLGDYVAPLGAPLPGIGSALQASLVDTEVRIATDLETAQPQAADADAIVVVVGGTSRRSYTDEFLANGALGGAADASCGEGVDLASVDLPPGQVQLVAALAARARGPVIGVVVAGRPHVMTPLADLCSALVWAGYPGPHGAEAIAKVLLGQCAPAGRLPFTAPAHAAVLPVRHNDRQSADGAYRDVERAVLFEFGTGLTYDDVEVTGLRVTQQGEQVVVEVDVVRSTPDTPARTLAVFVRRAGGIRTPRLRELVDVLRTAATGQTHVTLTGTIPLALCRATGATGPAPTTFQVEMHSQLVHLVEPHVRSAE